MNARTYVGRWWGLCGGCLVAHGTQAELRPVYRLMIRYRSEPLALTECMCAECWRLLWELEHVDFGLHRLPELADQGEESPNAITSTTLPEIPFRAVPPPRLANRWKKPAPAKKRRAP